MHAGPEIGVASTKAFISTLTVHTLLGVHLGRMRMLSAGRASEILKSIEGLPKQIDSLLKQNEAIKKSRQNMHRRKTSASSVVATHSLRHSKVRSS